MITFDFSKRKIRGWKRRVKKIQQWKNTYLELDMAALEAYDRDYVKVWIAPFFSLQKHTLPMWYKRLVIQALTEIHASWKMQLDTLGEPYYLKLWIFEKGFMWSQVVVSVRRNLHFYDQTFEGLEPVAGLPEGLATEAAEKFVWHKGFSVSVRYESELQEDAQEGFYSEAETQAIRDSAYLVEKKETEILYFMKEDVVWVGEPKTIDVQKH